MTRGDTRTAKARSLLLAEHAARCTSCKGGDRCADGAELRRVLLRDADQVGAGVLDVLTTFNRALRAELGARGLRLEKKQQQQPRRRRRSSEWPTED